MCWRGICSCVGVLFFIVDFFELVVFGVLYLFNCVVMVLFICIRVDVDGVFIVVMEEYYY